jgi:N6-adenosine-specific RNA methylase IME4
LELRRVDDSFRVVCADPAWQFSDRIGSRGADANYVTMNVDDLCGEFDLPPIADSAYLFCWRVSAMVEEAYRVVRAWGFVPKSEIVWRKLTKNGKPWFGMGHHVRTAHETCIVATRGKAHPKSRSIRSVFEAPVPCDVNGKPIHSAKPEEFYAMIEQLCDGPYCELFARRFRPGWTCLGNELPEQSLPSGAAIAAAGLKYLEDK